MLKRHMLAVAVTGAIASQTADQARAATITVDTASDFFIIIGDCGLRQAIQAADTDTAVAGCSAGSGNDLIEFDLSLIGSTITLRNGVIDIASSLTIDGSVGRSNITVSGNNASRIFMINDGDNGTQQWVTLRNLSLTEGSASGSGAIFTREDLTIDACDVSNNTAGGFGAGALSQGSSSIVTIQDSTFSNNTSSVSTGAIEVINRVTIDGSELIGNSAALDGGAIVAQFPTSTLSISNSLIEGNSAGFSGGGIFTAGRTTIERSILANNTADSGGGLFAFPNSIIEFIDAEITTNAATGGPGGGLHAVSAPVTLTRATVDNNSSSENGGGLAVYNGGLTLSSSQLLANTANVSGGGVSLATSTATLTGSTLSANLAQTANGGGLFNDASYVEIRNSTFSANSAAVLGGAIETAGGSLTLFNSTLSSNYSNDAGGGISSNSTSYLRNVTLIGNGAQNVGGGLINYDSLTARDLVIGSSTGGDCLLAGGSFPLKTFDLIEDGSCDPDLMGDPLLGPLTNNGGATLTHAPMSGSPLIDAGENPNCPVTDQVGMPRPIDGDADGSADCDIGAVEFVDIFGPTAMLNSAPDVVIPGPDPQPIVVDYFDDGAIDPVSLDVGDIAVMPGPLTISQVLPNADVSSVTYQVEAPAGDWDVSDNGSYTVMIVGGEVLDIAVTGANANLGAVLGTFNVAVPEIDITGSGTSIADGDLAPSDLDATDFGEVLVGGLAVRSFAISNIGGGTITLTNPVTIAGTGFTVTQPSSTVLNAGQSTIFDINFLPAVNGEITGLVTVSNSDFDENPYSFAVRANAVNEIILPELIFADGFEN